ncbi:MAG: type IV pili twitching motility protein PilT [Candidatus Blackburnbacteria bacterium RIFCSPLOWO2_01_FULL_41_27]|uniref:Type IV pili twitching motility protein PilT n=1 Tax=Candidatus Blackburnbacteria bacterium RIFCSPLOWO2_01_FULL_41_27 TaxID=1797520 RepID=A0A1G1VB60_9BACT|nr:MAG: type IV pili twitching motility protein PilT [Candidatus Blackburnbacteria bacterium RIFCSPLOWO2_01_FULL_41_27]
MEFAQLLQLVVDRKASDLHLVVGLPPMLRVDGLLAAVPNEQVLAPEDVDRLIKSFLTAEQIERVTVNKEIDLGVSFSQNARFRANIYHQRGYITAALRRIPMEIPTIEGLKLPQILYTFTKLRQGLVLVTGPTGHGKSTTIAAMLDEINKTRPAHILTIEDPIEFVFTPKQAMFSQREMREDTLSWEIALRSALREDPDIVLIGEMRDYETIAAALTIAETGHLVFATLHTNSAAQTIDRIVDVFPENQQAQVRLQLSNVLEGVFSQRLVPLLSGGRTAAYEVLTGTNAVRSTIRDGKTHQIDNIIQTSAEFGMTTLEANLATYVQQGLISLEEAVSFSIRPEELIRMVKGS